MGDEYLKRAIELCLAVYRVTERFPAAETLRSSLREVSLDIIKTFVYIGVYPTPREGRVFDFEGFKRRIRLFLVYCEIARNQNWADPRNFEVLRRAYKDFFGNVEKGPRLLGTRLAPAAAGAADSVNSTVTKRGPKAAGLSPRRLQIVRFLESSSESGASMADFASIIKGKSRKTIERDLKYLIGANLVLKKGRTKGVKFFKT